MSDDVFKDLQNIIDDINDYQLSDESFKRQVIDFVKSLNRFDQEYYDHLKNLTVQRADLNTAQKNFLIFVAFKAFQIGNSKVTRNTLKLLEYLEDAAKGAIPKLIELLQSETEHELIRIKIAEALARIGLTKYQDAQQLVECLNDPKPEIQENIIAAIATLRQEAAPVIPELQKVLNSNKDNDPPNENVLIAIISCFGEIGEKAGQGVASPLSEYLKPDYSTDIRAAAAKALARISLIPQAVIPDLTAGLESEGKPHDNLRRVAFVEALVKSKWHQDEIVHKLSHFVNDEDLQVFVIEALAKINSPLSVEILTKELLKTSDPSISKLLHGTKLNGKNGTGKSEFILSVISQDNRSAQSFSNLEFPHLFYAMLPASEKEISASQNRHDVETLCLSLIAKALEYQTNPNLFDLITRIIKIGSRLETRDLKKLIDNYEASNPSNGNLQPEDYYELRKALGDTSVLETEISELNAQLNNSLKKYLEALNHQGSITLSQTETQFKEILWMNRFIFGFGFTVATLSVIYFFYSLLWGAGDLAALKSVISLLGSATGIGSAFLILLYKPQKQGQEAINNLSKSNVILGGFVFEMTHIAECLARLQSQNNFNFDEFESGSKVIQEAYRNALQELQFINQDLSDG